MIETINIVGHDTWYLERPWCRGLGSPQGFGAVFNQKKNNNITYFIRDGIYNVDDCESKVKVALLTECRPFDIQGRYDFVLHNQHKFDHVVTYDDQLIKQLPDKSCPTPEGGTWVWPEKKQLIYPKSKLCSYIVSNKNTTAEQKMRVELLRLFYQNKKQYPHVDLFGRGHNPFPEDHDNDFDGKVEIAKDYAFSITMENWIQDNYFSEKIMDCFMMGTVPIYFGAREIGNYFNLNGIIIVNSIKDVLEVINNLSFEKYQKMMPSIVENYELAKKHIDTVSYSYNKFIRNS
tara:strand:- start:261 stop:1130 length:870 start_codon:yes stop_codon:yes gene_type:complete